MIGRAFPDIPGKMVPNKNYFISYNIAESTMNTHFGYGYTYVINEICTESGILDILKNIFAYDAMEIVAIVSYIIKNGSVMSGIGSWIDKIYLNDFVKPLSKQQEKHLQK
jgi:hypothetical protein